MNTQTYTIEVEQDETTKDYFLEFPDEVIKSMGWMEGDTLLWIDNKDGSFTLQKKEEK